MSESAELNLQYLCQNVARIAQLAGEEILKVYESSYTVEHKEDNTPLTTADLAADRLIRQELAILTPDIPILTEESEQVPFATRQSWQRYWLVDPLDGTREFIKRNGEFTVNIALIEQHKSILGVINAPVLGAEYFAWRDGPAFKQLRGKPPQQIHTRQANPGQLVVSGSRSHPSDRLQAYLEQIPGEVELLSVGSSLKSCMVAEGKVDLYPRLGLTSEWDTAAAQCIVEQAGGHMKQIDGCDMRYNTKDSLLNPQFLVYGDAQIPWHDYVENHNE